MSVDLQNLVADSEFPTSLCRAERLHQADDYRGEPVRGMDIMGEDRHCVQVNAQLLCRTAYQLHCMKRSEGAGASCAKAVRCAPAVVVPHAELRSGLDLRHVGVEHGNCSVHRRRVPSFLQGRLLHFPEEVQRSLSFFHTKRHLASATDPLTSVVRLPVST